MRTQGSRLPKILTETHRGCSPGTSHSLRIYPLRSACPAPPQRRVLGAPSCPAAVTARSGDALSSSRVRASVRPSEAVAALGCGLEPSGSPESCSGGTWETGAARGIPTPTPGPPDRAQRRFPPSLAARGAARVGERAWARRPRAPGREESIEV